MTKRRKNAPARCFLAALALAAAAGCSSAPAPPGAPVAPDDRGPGPLPAGGRCPDGQLCALVGARLADLGCVDEAGLVRGSVTCDPIRGTSCPSGHVCASLVGGGGVCIPRCSVASTRPGCAAGCFNQSCSGAYDLCLRSTGRCRPVPCRSDSDCRQAAGCDFPGRSTKGLVCDGAAGFCVRSR